MEPTPLTPQDPHIEVKNTSTPAPPNTASAPQPQSGTSVPAAPIPTPEVPQSQNAAAHIDLGTILLPKKEIPGHTPASAERVNAGVLLEQEQNATLLPHTPATETPPSAVPASAPEPKKEESSVRPIETYQGDIEDLIKDKNVSVLTIAAAEAERRGSAQTNTEAPKSSVRVSLPSSTLLKTIGMYAGGFLLLAGASGVLAYIVTRPASVSLPQAAPAPFVAVDDTKVITILPNTPRNNLISSLLAAKQATALSIGLISQLLVTTASTTASGQVLVPVSAQGLLALMAPNAPQGLLLTLRPTYLLGVHVYDNNQPFFVLSVDSYEQAYAGMLAWEPYMQQDLSPLFNYTPTAHIPEQGAATSTPPVQFIQSGFVDKIVENHDARVIQNSAGDITLLWTFLDRNTLVITTNDATLREIISRLQKTSTASVPGQ